MPEILRKLLRPPSFPDRERTRRAQTLHGTATIILGMCVFWVLATLVGFGLDPLRVPAGLLAVVGSAAARRLAVKGRHELGSGVLLGSGWLAMSLTAIAGGQVAAPTYAGFAVLVVAGGLVRGAYGAVAMAFLAVGSAAGITALDSAGWLPGNPSLHTPWTLFAANCVAIFSAAGMLAISDWRNREILELATASESRARQARSALEHSQDQLVRAQKMEAVGRLSGAVAHDFNNNLTVIGGYAALLEAGARDEETRKHAREVQEAVGKSAILTRQLLAFARKQVFAPERFDLGELVRSQADFLRKVLGEALVLEVEGGGGSLPVRADPVQVEQVLLNLVLNARDASSEGGRVSLACQRAARDGLPAVEVAVADQGCGMEAEVLARATEPFFTTKGEGQGSGLGLASVKSILERSDGGLSIYSELGVGTTVHFWLPLAEGDELPARPDAGGELPQGHGETVWVVEDQDALRRLVRRQLEGAGYVVVDSDGLAAVRERLEDMATAPDLLLSDVILPGGGGSEIAAAVQERFPGLPVLYMSGYLESTMVRKGLLAEGVALLPKPFGREDLLRRVRARLDDAPAGDARA